MPRTLEELAWMLAKRDNSTFEKEMHAIKQCAVDMEHAFYTGSLDEAEDILASSLQLEPDYLDLFIF